MHNLKNVCLQPNILFILIDSFSADQCHGVQKTSKTPNIDRLISNGVYFLQAITTSPTTIPAISSIFSASYPFKSIMMEEKLVRLNSSIPTFVEELTKFEYNVHAIVPNALDFAGLEKMFDSNIEKYDYESNLYNGVGDQISNKLKSIKSPWFLYLHLYDLHGTATFNRGEIPKEFFNKNNGRNQYERMVSLIDIWIGEFLDEIDMKNTLIVITADHGSDVGKYDEKMENIHKKVNAIIKQNSRIIHTASFLSKQIPKQFKIIRKHLGSSYKKMKNGAITDRKKNEFEHIIMNTKDPYEKRILENCVNGIQHIYDDKLKIPLIICGLNLTAKKISIQVRSIDIFPTIFDIIGLKSNITSAHGKSLLPLINGEKFDEMPILLESVTNSSDSLNNNTIGIRTSEFKYFRDKNDKNKNINLFNLKLDVNEVKNIASSETGLIEKMEKILLDITTSKQRIITTENTLSDEEKERAEETLRKLGYI